MHCTLHGTGVTLVNSEHRDRVTWVPDLSFGLGSLVFVVFVWGCLKTQRPFFASYLCVWVCSRLSRTLPTCHPGQPTPGPGRDLELPPPEVFGTGAGSGRRRPASSSSKMRCTATTPRFWTGGCPGAKPPPWKHRMITICCTGMFASWIEDLRETNGHSL